MLGCSHGARGVKKTGLVTFPPPFVSGEHFRCRTAQAGENFEVLRVGKEAVGALVSRAHLVESEFTAKFFNQGERGESRVFRIARPSRDLFGAQESGACRDVPS